jgi:hypothetical protein
MSMTAGQRKRETAKMGQRKQMRNIRKIYCKISDGKANCFQRTWNHNFVPTPLLQQQVRVF